MEQPRRNIELKAHDPSPEFSLGVCIEMGAQDRGEILQRDSYFAVNTGGLKLREETPGQPHLIQFQRPNEPQQRESRYRIIDVSDGETLRAALTTALGLRVVVTKRRRLFLWRNVRIHLDRVEHLGFFIELEAVAPPYSDLADEHRLISELREKLAITDDRLLGVGYAQQLEEHQPPHR